VADATYRVVLEYDGTDFAGFQFQPAIRTVAGEVERALSQIFDAPVKVTCAGRTDAGVHASGQVISFRGRDTFPVEKLALALYSVLPRDLSARDAARTGDDFSARHSALERRYEYRVLNRPSPSAVLRRYVHHEYRSIDDTRMREAAAHLIGEHDFVTFCSELPEKGTTVRELRAVGIVRDGEHLSFSVRGASFLHRMVRIIVGTLLDVGAGRREPDDVAAMLAARDRRAGGLTAPAHGLTLVEVVYPNFTSANGRA